MKKIISIFGFAIFLTVFAGNVFSQSPSSPPPPPPNPGTSSSGPVGGQAPIHGGVTLLLLLAAGYGLKRVIKEYKPESETSS